MNFYELSQTTKIHPPPVVGDTDKHNRIYQNKIINFLSALKEHKDFYHKEGYAIIIT
jgi:hypothetical protein